MMSAWILLAAGDPTEHVLPHPLFSIGPFMFTNQMLMVVIVAAIMLVLFPKLARNYPLVPTGIRSAFETLMEFIREGVARPALREHTERFIPFIWTLFFFILFNNLLGMIPLSTVAGLLTGNWHLFGTATANLSVTAALALIAFIMIHVSGILQETRVQRQHGRSAGTAPVIGFVMYWYHFVPHIPGVGGIILFPFFLVLELMGALVKPFALAIRLFANIMAGHILVGALLLLVPAIKSIASFGVAVPALAGCVALSGLDLFVAFLQAYIFTFLTCMFIGAAVSPEH